jgi:hypothetical protein
MPAQAGIQPLIADILSTADETWIPVSTGMTEGKSTSSRQIGDLSE